jgi:magnesium transporter
VQAGGKGSLRHILHKGCPLLKVWQLGYNIGSKGSFIQQEAGEAVPAAIAQPNGEDPSHPMQITIFNYSPDSVTVQHLKDGQLVWPPAQAGITWIHISGQVTWEILEQLAGHYQLHPLAIEDVTHQGQRSKLEMYDQNLFLAMYAMDHQTQERMQVSIFVGDSYVITIVPRENRLFEPLQELLQHGNSNLRKKGSDFLCYSLCDRIIDSVFPVLEEVGKEVFEMEDQIFSITREAISAKLHHLRVRLVELERIIAGSQEVIEDMRTGEIPLIQTGTLVYLRDCYDHTLQQLHSTDSYRQITASILESYLSLANNEMNEVIKVLTVVSTIFIPLTFITGVYGMNFDYMPELGHRFGYIGAWVLMAAVAGGMLLYYRRRRWL